MNEYDNKRLRCCQCKHSAMCVSVGSEAIGEALTNKALALRGEKEGLRMALERLGPVGGDTPCDARAAWLHKLRIKAKTATFGRVYGAK